MRSIFEQNIIDIIILSMCFCMYTQIYTFVCESVRIYELDRRLYLLRYVKDDSTKPTKGDT